LDTTAINVENLCKFYPNVKAVNEINFSVAPGEIFGFLGPNGAGKTTTIKMMMTLIPPTSGQISIYGVNILKDPVAARQILGYVPQELSVDGDLTGYENLLIYAKLCYVPRKQIKTRVQNALEYMSLADRANDLAKQYSGGMMRRLEIAQALVNQPKVLFLDEPSIGLDPAARRQVWHYIRDINTRLKTTIFITTHDMLEADELCSRIAFIDAGKIIISGTPKELKASIGMDYVTCQIPHTSSDQLLHLTIPAELGQIVPQTPNGAVEPKIVIATKDGSAMLPKILQFFISAGITLSSIMLNETTLDDVFLKYAHTRLQDGQSARDARMTRRSFKGHAK